MLQFHPSNPLRAVNWRWERARIMREANKERSLGTRTTDEYVLAAYNFQKKLFKCKDEVDRYELMDSDPDLFGAYLIYHRNDPQERNPARFAIEARLLSDQPDFEIAQKLGTSAGVIHTYEKLFFNVRDKLQNSDYVMTCVMSPAVHAGMTDRDYDLLWKLFGYLYGPVALDTFVTSTSRKFRPTSFAEVDAALAEDVRSSLQRKVAIVARTFTINPFSQSELLNTYARFLELEKDSGNEKSRDVILQNVQVMLDKLPVRVGNVNVSQPELINKYDSGAIEMCTNELLAASDGEDIMPTDVADLKFPEVKPNVKPSK